MAIGWPIQTRTMSRLKDYNGRTIKSSRDATVRISDEDGPSFLFFLQLYYYKLTVPSSSSEQAAVVFFNTYKMPRSTDCVGRIFRGRPQVLYKAHIAGHRIFSSCSRSAQEIELASPPPPPPSQGIPDPQTASTLAEEAALKRAGIWPIGSRRRRVALANSQNIPFEQLPYQCFQEARKVLLEDRRDKLQQIERQRHKIQNLRARAVSEEVHTIPRQAESARRNSITSSQHYLYKLKILADINDPLVKKRFEDGKGWCASKSNYSPANIGSNRRSQSSHLSISRG